MGYDGISMNTTVMAGYSPPNGFTEVPELSRMQCAMDEMVALAEVAVEMAKQFQKFAFDANAGLTAYRNQVHASVRDYYHTDVDGSTHFDGVVPSAWEGK